MGRILFAVFMIVPLVEIAFFVVIGNTIGLWPTLAGVLVTAVAGSLILRWQGLQLLNEIRSSMGQGRLPARALADAMMVAIAGVLLLTPGYFSDLIGILLLLPPVRTLIYEFLRTRIHLVPTMTGGATGQARPAESGTIDLEQDDYRRR